MTAISSWVNRTSRTARVAAAVGLLSIAALMALVPMLASARGASREIVLVARQMAFYVEGSEEPNPALRVRPGEEIRIVFRNEDPGVSHDLQIGAVDAALDPIRAGATATVTFRAPARPGRYEYVCRPHAQMMKGVLVVAAE